MKKYCILFAAAFLALASCSIEVDFPAQEGTTVYITAVTGHTKTTESGATFSWTDNEQISVRTSDCEYVNFANVDQDQGLFSHTFGGDVPDLLLAVSPAQPDGPTFVDADAYEICLPASYDYAEGVTNALMVGVPDGENDYRFLFYHAAALVKVTYANVPVGTKSFVLETPNDFITGTYDLNGTEISDIEITNENEGNDGNYGKSVTITLPEKVSSLNTTLSFYIPVPTGTYHKESDASIKVYLKNASGAKIASSEKSLKKNITLNRGDVFYFPTITLDPEVVIKWPEWTYTFTAKKFSGNGTQTLTVGTEPNEVSMDWTLAGSYSNPGYWTYDGTKGQQFGSGNKPYSSLTLTANTGINGIEDVVINTSGASDINATVSVSVGGTPFVIKDSDPAITSQSLTATATEYNFTSPDGELYCGDIVISYANSSSKAIYLKTISLNPDTRIDPELAYSPAAYSVVASSSFETPELSSVDGFNGTVTYAIGGEDDPDVASVNAETGAVTIGSKAGSVTVTATFAGNANYKPDSASYTITVGAAALSVSTTTPENAACEDDATTTFTVTSNVPWTAVASSNGSYIKGIYVGETQINTATPVVQEASADAITVTVKFNANDGEERSATIAVNPTDQTHYAALNKTVTVTQDEYLAPSGKVFTRISSSDDLTLGTDAEYLLIYVPASGDPLAFDGSLTSGYDQSTGVKVKFDDNGDADYDTYKGYALTISAAKTTNKYWIKTAGGKYIGRNASSNGLDEYTPTNESPTPGNNTNYDNGIAFSNTSVVSITGNGGRALCYYSNNSNYRYYAAGNVATLYLYKYEDTTTWDLESIAVKTAPTKTSYEAGEHFDPTGLVITATYYDHDGVKNDKTVDVAYSNATAEEFTFAPTTSDALTADVEEVSITWGGKSTTQAITVDAVYAVTFEAPSHGSLTVLRGESELSSGNSVPAGATINVTATPDSGYELSTLVYNDGSNHDIKADKTFTMPAQAVSITATFAEIVTPTISMNTTSITNVAAAGGSATATGAYTLLNGASNDDVEITFDGCVTEASKTATPGDISYTVAKNTGAAREGHIYVQYSTEAAHTITVSQLAGTLPVSGLAGSWSRTSGSASSTPLSSSSGNTSATLSVTNSDSNKLSFATAGIYSQKMSSNNYWLVTMPSVANVTDDTSVTITFTGVKKNKPKSGSTTSVVYQLAYSWDNSSWTTVGSTYSDTETATSKSYTFKPGAKASGTLYIRYYVTSGGSNSAGSHYVGGVTVSAE